MHIFFGMNCDNQEIWIIKTGFFYDINGRLRHFSIGNYIS